MERRELLKYSATLPVMAIMMPMANASASSVPATADELYRAASEMFGVAGYSSSAYEVIGDKKCAHQTYKAVSDNEAQAVEKIWSAMVEQHKSGARGIVWRVAPYYMEQDTLRYSDGSMERRPAHLRTRYSFLSDPKQEAA